MRKIFFVSFFAFFACLAAAQEKKTITVNTIHPDNRELTNSIYHYPKFRDGKVVFKDSVIVEATMNYHRLYGQILFISLKNDTLALAHPETFDHVILDKDTFHFYDKSFLRKVTHYKKNNLLLNQTIKYIGKEKPGPYGTYSSTSATDSSPTFTTDNQITNQISLNENLIYKFTNEFYIADEFNNFFKATKKNFYNLFSAHEKQLRAYLADNDINFNKQADLEKLLQHLHSL